MSDENEEKIDTDKVIREYCIEYSNSKTRTEAESDYRKEATNQIHEKTNVPKNILKFCAERYHNQDFDQKSEEQDEYQTFYARIFHQKSNDANADDEVDY